MSPESIADIRHSLLIAIAEIGCVLCSISQIECGEELDTKEVVGLADSLDDATLALNNAASVITNEAYPDDSSDLYDDGPCICPRCLGVGDEPPPAVPLQDCDECGGNGVVATDEEGGK